jgi:hypothetical protein
MAGHSHSNTVDREETEDCVWAFKMEVLGWQTRVNASRNWGGCVAVEGAVDWWAGPGTCFGRSHPLVIRHQGSDAMTVRRGPKLARVLYCSVFVGCIRCLNRSAIVVILAGIPCISATLPQFREQIEDQIRGLSKEHGKNRNDQDLVEQLSIQ